MLLRKLALKFDEKGPHGVGVKPLKAFPVLLSPRPENLKKQMARP